MILIYLVKISNVSEFSKATKENTDLQDLGLYIIFNEVTPRHYLEISGNPYKKSEILYAYARNPFEKCWSDLPHS